MSRFCFAAGAVCLSYSRLLQNSIADNTCAISSVVLIIFARPFKSANTCSTARLMPLLKSIGFMPAATDLHPSERMALVNTVAVVVPACPFDGVSDVAMI